MKKIKEYIDDDYSCFEWAQWHSEYGYIWTNHTDFYSVNRMFINWFQCTEISFFHKWWWQFAENLTLKPFRSSANVASSRSWRTYERLFGKRILVQWLSWCPKWIYCHQIRMWQVDSLSLNIRYFSPNSCARAGFVLYSWDFVCSTERLLSHPNKWQINNRTET